MNPCVTVVHLEADGPYYPYNELGAWRCDGFGLFGNDGHAYVDAGQFDRRQQGNVYRAVEVRLAHTPVAPIAGPSDEEVKDLVEFFGCLYVAALSRGTSAPTCLLPLLSP